MQDDPVETARGRERWYHATLSGDVIDDFSGLHFGTWEAAMARLRDVRSHEDRPWRMAKGKGQPCIYVAEISMERPFLVGDGHQDEQDIVDDLLSRGIFCPADLALMSDEGMDAYELLHERGYDVQIYVNAMEDAGSVSCSPLQGHRVRILDVVHLDPDTLEPVEPPSPGIR